MTVEKYRLVTRSDFDGLVCAVLLRALDMIDDIAFVHPKDVQDGVVEVTERDILTNLPYASAAHMVFDHHHSEALRTGGTATNHVIDAEAPSAARVVYEYFGGPEAFPLVSEELMRAVDQADSADYALHDILEPRNWTLLNFLMDSRTGLGRFRDFRISNYELMMQLIDEVLQQEAVDDDRLRVGRAPRDPRHPPTERDEPANDHGRSGHRQRLPHVGTDDLARAGLRQRGVVAGDLSGARHPADRARD